jgi:hypothetical protein
MAITTSLGANNSISGSIGSTSSLSARTATISKGNVVAISLPGPRGISGDDAIAATLGLSGLVDVDITNLVEGSLLMYSLAEGKWKARNDLGSAITLPLQNQDGGTF